MTVVMDASAVVAALADAGPVGEWARSIVTQTDLAAPHLMPAEVSNVLRLQILRGRLTASSAALAHAELDELRVVLYPYAAVADRVWTLKDNLNAYDAWYVALAEQLGAPFATLDRRLALASGPRCVFRVPPAPDTIETGME